MYGIIFTLTELYLNSDFRFVIQVFISNSSLVQLLINCGTIIELTIYKYNAAKYAVVETGYE